MSECPHKQLKKQMVGTHVWYACECDQKFRVEPWDGRVKVVEGPLTPSDTVGNVIAELRHVASEPFVPPLKIHVEALQICMELQADKLERIAAAQHLKREQERVIQCPNCGETAQVKNFNAGNEIDPASAAQPPQELVAFVDRAPKEGEEGERK